MTAARDHELDAVRAHLAALRPDGQSEATSERLGVDLARTCNGWRRRMLKRGV